MHRWTIMAALALAGIVAGIAAKAADESTVGWASDLGTYPAIWVLAIAAIGRFAPSGPWAAARATAFFLGLTMAYYAWSALVMGFDIDRGVLVWSVLAVTAVPSLAAAVWWAAPRTGILPPVVMAGVAGLALADGTIHQIWLALIGELPPDFPLRPVQAIADVLVALLIAGWMPVPPWTRIGAVALTPIMAILAGLVIDEVVGRLVY